MKFDMTRLRKAVKTLAVVTSKSKPKIIRQAAKGCITTVIRITPPASQGTTGAAAKKAGEQTVLNDVLKLVVSSFVPGRNRKQVLATRAELLAAHERSRSGVKGGRVNPRNRKPLLMAPVDVAAVVTLLQKNVGILAAGWNKAAAKLGVPVPAWIRRHGDSAGVVKVEEFGGLFRITVGNAVNFVGDVDGYGRRIKSAVTIEAGKLERQAAYLLQAARRKARLK